MNEDRKVVGMDFVSRILFIFLQVCVVLLLALAFAKIPKVQSFDTSVTILTSEWEYETSSGKTGSIYPKEQIPMEIGETVCLWTTIPDDVVDGDYIVIRSGRSTNAYVDGELRYSVNMRPIGFLGVAVKSLDMPIPVSAEDRGKILLLERTETDSNNANLNEVVYGSGLGILGRDIDNSGIPFLLAFVLAIFSLMTVGMGMCFRLRYHKGTAVGYMGAGILLLSLWKIFDDPLFQFLFHSYLADGVAGYLTILFVPYTLSCYMDIEQNFRYRKFYLWIKWLSLLNLILLLGLQLTNIATLEMTRGYMQTSVMLFMVPFVVFFFLDWKNGKIEEYFLLGIGFISFLGFIALEIINMNRGNRVIANDGVLVILGLFVLLGAAVAEAIRNLWQNQKAAQEALLANKMKSDFLANMSHEIRTPINAVLGMNEMIRREGVSPDILSYSENIKRSGEMLLSLINDILDFSKIESGNMELVQAEYRLDQLIRDLDLMISPLAKRKQLDFSIEVKEELPSVLFGDYVRMKQVVANLLSNAVKYTPQGSVHFLVDDVRRDGRYYLRFQVSDTGRGIREEDIPHLFDAFKRMDEKETRGIEGTGLGLAITYRIVELMEGKIEVESTYGEGSVFTALLPQTIVSDLPIGVYSTESDAESVVEEVLFEAPGASVLVVDDNPTNLSVVSLLLKRTKIQLTLRGSGAEALAGITNGEHYDLILLDHMMTGMDGIETLKQFRMFDQYEKVPVIALTANAIAGAREFYLESGFQDYLSKPIEGVALERLLLKWLPEALIFPANQTGPDEFGESRNGYILEEELGRVLEIDMNACRSHLPTPELLHTILFQYPDAAKLAREELWEQYLLVRESGSDESILNYRIKVHGMKNTAATIGAVALSEQAKELELSAAEGDSAKILAETESFLAAWDDLAEKIREILPNKQEEAKMPLPDPERLEELLKQLIEALEDCRIDDADECFKTLEQFAWPENAGSAIEELRAAVVDLDAERALLIKNKLCMILDA